jgi:two-component system, sensor histidine kinase and response regulator
MRKGIIYSFIVLMMFSAFSINAFAKADLFTIKQFENLNLINQHSSYQNLIPSILKFWDYTGKLLPIKYAEQLAVTENNQLLKQSKPLFGLVAYNSNTDEISLNKAVMLWGGFLIIGLFIGATYFLKGRRQKHLEHEKNLMQSLIDNIPDTIYFKDLDSKFTRINKAQAKLLGVKHPDDVIGKSDFDFFKHAQQAYDTEQEIIRTRIPIMNQINTVESNGITKYLSDTKIPLIDSKNKCIGTVGITRDITSFKTAEDAMLESQAKFKALFENAPLAIFRLDKDMKVVECNHRFRKMFGYSPDDDLTLVSKFDLLVDPDIGALILDTIMETKEVNTEIMMKKKNGDQFIANLTLALLEEGFREVTIEGIVEDITQVAKARDEIIKAKDKAIEADRLKSLFLANMSHEIRTPMNAIIGFTNMLREESCTPQERNSYIDVIQSNGNSLMTLIDSIVDFSKLEADQMSISMGEFNFVPLFDSVCDHAEKILLTEEKTHIKLIRTKGIKENVRILSDRHRLNQVLNHLISNAVKFTDKGEIEIGYKIEDNNLVIYVRDTGIGIPKDKLGTIFNRFTKVNNDKNRLFGGTGIGLTISKGLMKLMGGKIDVESEFGQGSTFWLKINLAKANNKA